jgi:hypothetical protein
MPNHILTLYTPAPNREVPEGLDVLSQEIEFPGGATARYLATSTNRAGGSTLPQAECVWSQSA